MAHLFVFATFSLSQMKAVSRERIKALSIYALWGLAKSLQNP